MSPIAALIFAGIWWAAPSGAEFMYPETPRGDQADTVHGFEVRDPYRWLEDMDDPRTLDWASAQTALAREYLDAPDRAAVRSGIAELSRLERFGWGTVTDRGTFLMRVPAGSRRGEVVVRTLAGESRVLLSHPYGWPEADDVRLTRPSASPDGRYLAWPVSLTGSQWRPLRILEVEDGRLLDESLSGLHSLNTGLTWDSAGFYYVRWERRAASDPRARNARIFYHRLGSAQREDRLIFDTLGEDWLMRPQLSADGRFLVVEAREGAAATSHIFVRNLDRSDRVFTFWFGERPGSYLFLGGSGDRLYFYSDYGAKNGQIIAVEAGADPNQTPRVIVPESDHSVYAGSLVGGNAVGMFGDRILVTYSRHGVPETRGFDLAGEHQYTLSIPEGASIWGGFSASPNSTDVIFRTLNLFDSGTVHRLDVTTGRQEIVARPAGGLDPRDYTVRHLFYRSADGTRVPMFLAHRNGLERNGQQPVFMYGYGAYGWVSLLFYQAHVSYWLEQGGIYAQPGLRGGGEYGAAWREAGQGVNKTNTIADYLAAAEWLVEAGYTRPGMIVANGGSASGFLPAAAFIRRPELFGAAVIDIPILDLLRMEHFGNGAFARAEYGSPSNPAEFSVLRKLSPYHTLAAGVCYPPTLVLVGENDHSAVPAHGYKFAAALQHAQGQVDDCEQPALLKVMTGAGHNFGGTPEEVIESRTDQVLFAMRAVGLE